MKRTGQKLGQLTLFYCALAWWHTPEALAQGAALRFGIATDQIISSMQARQLPTEGVQVTLPTAITSSVRQPALEIQTVTMLSAHSAQLKLRCTALSECLPFYVSVTWPDAAPRLTSARLKLGQPLPGELHETAVSSSLRAGTVAFLVLEHERVHIRLRVISLETGIPGDNVRVTTLDHKQAYVAQIVTPNLLKGSF